MIRAEAALSTPTTAPHWSLYALDRLLPTLVLPAEPTDPTGPWAGRWRTFELLDGPARILIEGSTTLSLSPNPTGLQLDVYEDTTLSQRMYVRTSVTAGCDDDLMVTPRWWRSQFISGTYAAAGDFEETAGAHEGEVHADHLRIVGVDDSRVALPADAPVTSSWGMLAALPRLAAAGIQQKRFTLLEGLLLVREEQLLRRVDSITVNLADGPMQLDGWLHRGRGSLPLYLWTGPGGYPLLAGSLARFLVAESFTVPSGGA